MTSLPIFQFFLVLLDSLGIRLFYLLRELRAGLESENTFNFYQEQKTHIFLKHLQLVIVHMATTNRALLGSLTQIEEVLEDMS